MCSFSLGLLTIQFKRDLLSVDLSIFTVVCNTFIAYSPGNFLFFGIITTDTEQVVNQKKLKQDQILDIVPQMKKVQRLVEIFVGKGFLHRTAQVILSALHCKDRIFKIHVKAMSLSLE